MVRYRGGEHSKIWANLSLLKIFLEHLFIYSRERKWGSHNREREREFSSRFTTECGAHSWACSHNTWGHYLGQDQESVTQLTETPRCPQISVLLWPVSLGYDFHMCFSSASPLPTSPAAVFTIYLSEALTYVDYSLPFVDPGKPEGPWIEATPFPQLSFA